MDKNDDIAIGLIIALIIWIGLCWLWSNFGYWWWESFLPN